jgi:hypothetical protein
MSQNIEWRVVLSHQVYALNEPLTLRDAAKPNRWGLWMSITSCSMRTMLDAGCIGLARNVRRALRRRLARLPPLEQVISLMASLMISLMTSLVTSLMASLMTSLKTSLMTFLMTSLPPLKQVDSGRSDSLVATLTMQWGAMMLAATGRPLPELEAETGHRFDTILIHDLEQKIVQVHERQRAKVLTSSQQRIAIKRADAGLPPTELVAPPKTARQQRLEMHERKLVRH